MNHNPWARKLFRPLAVAAMVGCVVLSFTDLARVFLPDWNGTYLVVGVMLAALEACYSYRVIRARHLQGIDVLRFRAVEVATLLIVLRVGRYAGQPWPEVLATFEALPRQPLDIIDAEAVFAFIVTLLAWSAATESVRDLDRLSLPLSLQRDSSRPVKRITGRFFAGGAVLLVATGLARIGLAGLLTRDQVSVPGLVVNALVYFVLGLAMLGQAHATRLHRQWQAQGLRIAKKLTSRWAPYSLALVGLAAILALVLPTGYTVGLLNAGRAVLRMLGYVMSLLSLSLAFVIALVFWLFSVLWSMLFGGEPPLSPAPGFPRQELDRQAGALPNWIDLLRSLLFWVIAAEIIVYVVRSYLRDHPELLASAAAWLKGGPLREVLGFLISFWRRITGLVHSVREHLPRRPFVRRPRPAPPRERFPFFRLGALEPRDRIGYYYLSLLRRASRLGLPRRQTQTPYEYASSLGPHLPDAQGELASLTDAFVEARYSLHAIGKEREKQVRADWHLVRTALRSLERRRRDVDSP